MSRERPTNRSLAIASTLVWCLVSAFGGSRPSPYFEPLQAREKSVESPELFASELFVSVLSSSILVDDADALSVGIVDGEGRSYEFTRGGATSSVASDTPFRLASVSKTITATAVLELVDDGKIALEDRPVASVLARRGLSCDVARIDKVRVRDLLAHTSGFDSGREWFFDEVVRDVDDLVGRFCSVELRSPPGTTYRYSNFNYLLLGWLIEDVTGEPYQEAVRELLLEPANLESFRFHVSSELDPDEPRYHLDPGSNYMELLGGAGAWSATSLDVARFIDQLAASERGEGFLSARLWRQMSTPSPRSGSGVSVGYGFGLRLFPDNVWGHTGSIQSIRAAAVHMADGASVAILVNGDRPESSDELVERVEVLWWATHYVGPIFLAPPT